MKRILNPFSRTQERPIPWKSCPRCGNHVDHRSIEVKLISDARVEQEIANGEAPPWDDLGFFNATCRCPSCGERMHSAGSFSIELEYNDQTGDQEEYTLYAIQWLSHWPMLVSESPKIPVEIVAVLRRADSLFWLDFAACATALRTTVETFLDAQAIARINTRARPLGLDSRIALFVEQVEKQDQAAAEKYEILLRAPKFIGDDGTHALTTVGSSDLRTAAECVARVLAMRYPDEDEVFARAARIAARHPSPRQRKRRDKERIEDSAAAPETPPSANSGTAGK